MRIQSAGVRRLVLLSGSLVFLTVTHRFVGAYLSFAAFWPVSRKIPSYDRIISPLAGAGVDSGRCNLDASKSEGDGIA